MLPETGKRNATVPERMGRYPFGRFKDASFRKIFVVEKMEE